MPQVKKDPSALLMGGLAFLFLALICAYPLLMGYLGNSYGLRFLTHLATTAIVTLIIGALGTLVYLFSRHR
jgi:hypothetical protein